MGWATTWLTQVVHGVDVGVRVDQVFQHALDSQAGSQDQRCCAVMHAGVQVCGSVPYENLDNREGLRLGRQGSEAAGPELMPGNQSTTPQSPSWGLRGPSQRGRREEHRKGGTPPATARRARGRSAGLRCLHRPVPLMPKCGLLSALSWAWLLPPPEDTEGLSPCPATMGGPTPGPRTQNH